MIFFRHFVNFIEIGRNSLHFRKAKEYSSAFSFCLMHLNFSNKMFIVLVDTKPWRTKRRFRFIESFIFFNTAGNSCVYVHMRHRSIFHTMTRRTNDKKKKKKYWFDWREGWDSYTQFRSCRTTNGNEFDRCNNLRYRSHWKLKRSSILVKYLTNIFVPSEL